jgi:hypothetical protein
VVPLYYIRNTLIYRRIYIGHAAVPPHIYVYTPIRVGIHIACIPQKLGVGDHIDLYKSLTPDVVYTNIL